MRRRCRRSRASIDRRSRSASRRAIRPTTGWCCGRGSHPIRSRPGGGMPDEAVRVVWEVAEDEQFARIVARANTEASPLRAHAVHVEVDGLRPARPYWYRFRVGTWESPVGRTRTAPEPSADVDRVRLAFASCQHWEHGYYTAHRHLAREDLDAVLFLGDYIYEYATFENPVRPVAGPEATTLDGYRQRYAQYKTDPGPPGGARGVPVHRHLGRPRGRQRLRQRPVAGRRPARAVPAPPRRGLPGLLRAHAAAPRPPAAGPGHAALPVAPLRPPARPQRPRHAPVPGRRSPAAAARARSATGPAPPARPSSASASANGCSITSPPRPPAGTCWRSRC